MASHVASHLPRAATNLPRPPTKTMHARGCGARLPPHPRRAAHLPSALSYPLHLVTFLTLCMPPFYARLRSNDVPAALQGAGTRTTSAKRPARSPAEPPSINGGSGACPYLSFSPPI
jgi:hypothetical protein